MVLFCPNRSRDVYFVVLRNISNITNTRILPGALIRSEHIISIMTAWGRLENVCSMSYPPLDIVNERLKADQRPNSSPVSLEKLKPSDNNIHVFSIHIAKPIHQPHISPNSIHLSSSLANLSSHSERLPVPSKVLIHTTTHTLKHDRIDLR